MLQLEPSLPVFARESVLATLDGDVEFVCELIDLFLTDFPTHIRNMQIAVQSDNANALMHTSHRLKSSAGNLGGKAAQARLAELEAHSRKGEARSAEQFHKQTEIELHRFAEELRLFLSEHRV